MNKSKTHPFHLLSKPTGAVCNLNCKYCFFLTKEKLYPGSSFRMSDEVLESYIQQYINSQPGPEITIAWQGGEPTLMGIGFFKKSIELEKKYKKPGTHILNTMQTNGTLINDEWAEFLKTNNFLVGISIDGPQEFHDSYRVDKGGQGTFSRVMKGVEFLKEYNVEYNVLTTVNAANQDYPLEVYKFLRDEIEAQYAQFIPIVERENTTGYQEGNKVTNRSVDPTKYGDFLIKIFDEWVRNDVGSFFVQIFEVALEAWYYHRPSLCIFREECGDSLALEHTGDLYSCDHFVEPNYLLGNIMEAPMIDLVLSEKQRAFGKDKNNKLTNYCKNCDVRFACNGGCPKNRFINSPDGEYGLNYLCTGYKKFFKHIDRPMKIMASMLQQNRSPANVMRILEIEEEL